MLRSSSLMKGILCSALLIRMVLSNANHHTGDDIKGPIESDESHQQNPGYLLSEYDDLRPTLQPLTLARKDQSVSALNMQPTLAITTQSTTGDKNQSILISGQSRKTDRVKNWTELKLWERAFIGSVVSIIVVVAVIISHIYFRKYRYGYRRHDRAEQLRIQEGNV